MRRARVSEQGLLGVLGALVLLPCTSACGPRLSEEECRTLLDKYTEKVIDQAKPSLSQGERIEKQQQARKMAELDPEFAKCASEVSRSAFECAMRANNADEIERCLL